MCSATGDSGDPRRPPLLTGRSLFGVMMAVFLLKDHGTEWVRASERQPTKISAKDVIERQEKLYSIAGLVAKLGLLFSEYAAHVGSVEWAAAVLGIEAVLFIFIVVASLRTPLAGQSTTEETTFLAGEG